MKIGLIKKMNERLAWWLSTGGPRLHCPYDRRKRKIKRESVAIEEGQISSCTYIDPRVESAGLRR